MHEQTYRTPLTYMRLIVCMFPFLCGSTTHRLQAQSPSARGLDNPHTLYAGIYPEGVDAALPDAPAAHEDSAALPPAFDLDNPAPAAPTRSPRFAPRPLAPQYDKYIEPSQRARPLLGFEHKFVFGLSQIASPYFAVSVLASSSYEQVTNAAPNFGNGGEAYAKRIGAAVIRDVSQSVFTDGLMPTVFHQDPRYYVMSRNRSVIARGTYAISRVFVTRSDDGRNVPNYSLFAGHAETAILQNAYYPTVNQGVRETAKGYAGSFAGVALSNAIREFFPDILHLVHLE